MAGGQERILKRRIRSVTSIRKTTRALELISGSRIVRAQHRIQAARPYVERLNRLGADLAAAPGGSDNRLLRRVDDPQRLAIVIIASDRGLAGAYDNTVMRAVERQLLSRPGQTELIAVGRKAQSYLRYRGYKVSHRFTGMTDRPTHGDAAELADLVARPFQSGEVDRVDIASTRFQSAGVQRVELVTALPAVGRDAEPGERHDYELEPERDDLLDVLARPLLEARLFLALLEAAASEHAARQRAMKAATDNADDLITTLRRVMNRARQDAITTEIMDIVGGAEALRQAASAGTAAGEAPR